MDSLGPENYFGVQHHWSIFTHEQTSTLLQIVLMSLGQLAEVPTFLEEYCSGEEGCLMGMVLQVIL